ncbi:MAG TPA: hypothetical protein PLU53_02940 [Bacteroidia bacterium]|nr:hypothetical protein [Bacteroidia bacterium]
MATQELHHQIDARLKQLLDMHREMQQHAASIPYAEIDLFLQKVRQLYEASLLLHHHNALKTMEELETAIAERYAKQTEPVRVHSVQPETVVPVIAPIDSKAPVGETLAHASIPSTPSVVAETPDRHSIEELIAAASPKADTISTLPDSQKQKKVSGDLHEMYQEVPTLAGKFEDIETLGDRIATNSSAPRIGEKLQRKPVKDLKSAIGINEKFQFISQLFGGDARTYHATIDQLDSFSSMEAAKAYLTDHLLPKYQWDTSSTPAVVFIDLLERRFLA